MSRRTGPPVTEAALFFSPVARLGLLVLGGVTLYALTRGDRTVRIAAILNASNWIGVNLAQPIKGGRVDADVFPAAQFAIDAAFAVIFVALAVFSRRGWLAVMSAFLVVGVANYASHLEGTREWHRAFVTASYLWGYGALGCLLVGATLDRRSRRIAAA